MKRTPLRRKTPLRASAAAVQAFKTRVARLARKVRVKAANPARKAKQFKRAYGSAERVEWIKTQPCVVRHCQRTPCENAHIRTDGVSRKADARFVVPLCGGLSGHHAVLHRIGRDSFETVYHVSLDVMARLTEARWQAYVASVTSVARDGGV